MEVKELIIAKASIKDVNELMALGVTTFREAFGPHNRSSDMDKYVAEEMNIAKLTEELNDADNLFFLAHYNDVPAGYAKLRINKEPDELKNNNPIEIERIYVLKEYQGKKIGVALMSRCIAHALDNRHDILWLGVWEYNYKAVEFYKQWGFELFGAHEFILGDDIQTDVLMKKML